MSARTSQASVLNFWDSQFTSRHNKGTTTSGSQTKLEIQQQKQTYEQIIVLFLQTIPNTETQIFQHPHPCSKTVDSKAPKRASMFIAASDIMFRCVFDGSISMDSMEIERRPYHRNCNCALHRSKAGSSTSFPQPRNILFPEKQSWRD
ncbi:hypothetical protein POTOM_025891 [Populus tomentosa]|uniref:Uncharacterized protein n=1 Tax=Populus tomentosa TaxID=118781 RepID=A0A8X7ZJG0_POPTO|nr:hypothetical protein POTOM_025891 [Populus tomentosa]